MAKSTESSAKTFFKKQFGRDIQLMGWNSDKLTPNDWSAVGVSFNEINKEKLVIGVRYDAENAAYFVTHVTIWGGERRGGLTSYELFNIPSTHPVHEIKSPLKAAKVKSSIIQLLSSVPSAKWAVSLLKGNYSEMSTTKINMAPRKPEKAVTKQMASAFETKPYYIIFAKSEDSGWDWEQGFGDYNKNVVIQERKDEYNRDRGYTDWFIADFDAPKRGGPASKIVSEFEKDLNSGKLKITKSDLIGASRTFNASKGWKSKLESSLKHLDEERLKGVTKKQIENSSTVSPWSDTSSLDDVYDPSIAGLKGAKK